MAVKFNPFTGQLQIDEKGSGGGSAFFAGEVDTYVDLPLDGTAALNSRWLVRNNSGTWPFSSYKQAGIYIRIATVGSSRDNDYKLTDTSFHDVMSDDAFLLFDNGDATKTAQFQLSGITAGQNRVLTVPNASGTIARTEDFAAPPAIGNTTAASGAFTTLNANNGTITASAPVLDLAQTWNNAAVTFTALKIAVTNTASASTSALANFEVGAASMFSVTRTGSMVTGAGSFAVNGSSGNTGLWNGGAFGWSSSATATSSIALDTTLFRDAADALAQRRTTNPQVFRIYNTFTDASNHERGFMRWSSNVLQIGTEKAGTGSARALEFQTDGTTRLTLASTGSAVFAQASVVGATWYFGHQNRSIFKSPSDGVLTLMNWAETDFGRLQFGGTTSSFPALKRSSTTLQVRLADDSAYTVLDAQLRAQGTAPATSGATGTAGDIRYDADYIYVCTATNTWKRAAIATW